MCYWSVHFKDSNIWVAPNKFNEEISQKPTNYSDLSDGTAVVFYKLTAMSSGCIARSNDLNCELLGQCSAVLLSWNYFLLLYSYQDWVRKNKERTLLSHCASQYSLDGCSSGRWTFLDRLVRPLFLDLKKSGKAHSFSFVKYCEFLKRNLPR